MHDLDALAKELERSESSPGNTPASSLHGFRSLAGGFLENSLNALFPYLGDVSGNRHTNLDEAYSVLRQILALTRHSAELADRYFGQLANLRQRLHADAVAILEGDPAAKSLEEVVICYPGFYATAVHRIAHELEKLGTSLLARYLSETAHRKTGIDIHPGAQIGDRFCIDHGTGIVIGETTIIGNDVKLYHGVTLGGLSVLKSLASKKRHPTIEDRVVIYSNAVILGGETLIGADSIIGGNVWLTRSIPANSIVEQQDQQVSIRARKQN